MLCRISTVLSLLVLFGAASPLPAYAADSEIVCAAILPCNSDSGELLPEYDLPGDPCYKTYREQCLRAQDFFLRECRSENDSLHSKVKRLKRKVRKLRKRRSR